MLHYSISEIIKIALELSQCGSADIPFNTLISFVDNEYRNLQNELIRSGKSGIKRIADLGQKGWSEYYHCYEYQVPYGVSQIIACYKKDSNQNTELHENRNCSYNNYFQQDDSLFTNNPGPLFIEYNPILRTPTFTRKSIKEPNLIAYDNTTNTKYYQLDATINLITDSNNNEYTASKLRSIDGLTVWLNNGDLFANNNLIDTQVLDFEIDSTKKILTNKDSTIVNWQPTYTWNNSSLKIIDNQVLLDDQVIEEDADSIVVHPSLFAVNKANEVIIYADNRYVLNNIDIVLALNPNEENGLGIVGVKDYETVLAGYTPNTELEFFHTVYYDVLVYRLAGVIMSYLGMPVGNQSILIKRVEDKAFQQNKRSHTPLRIKNVRSN